MQDIIFTANKGTSPMLEICKYSTLFIWNFTSDNSFAQVVNAKFLKVPLYDHFQFKFLISFFAFCLILANKYITMNLNNLLIIE